LTNFFFALSRSYPSPNFDFGSYSAKICFLSY